MTPPRFIPLCEPFLGGRERQYVDECITSGWVSSVGQFVNRFEDSFATRLETPGAVAVASGTAAIHLALLAVGVLPDDEVLVPSMTFIAPANAVRYAGAWPVFVDAEPRHWQMDVAAVRDFLRDGCENRGNGLINRATGRKVTAILPVHILGHPVEMEVLLELANAYGLKVIEDATESLGATSHGRAIGTIGHVGCFSFNGNKLITSGGGGMVVSHDPGVLKTVRHLSTQAKEPGGEYIHDAIGFNYRLTNVQAALGLAQFEQLDDFLAKKRGIADLYQRELSGVIGLTLPEQADGLSSAWWLYSILVQGGTSRNLIQSLADASITARPLWQPLHLSRPHAGSFSLPCPVAERLFADGVSLPSSVNLSESDQLRVCQTIRNATNPH